MSTDNIKRYVELIAAQERVRKAYEEALATPPTQRTEEQLVLIKYFDEKSGFTKEEAKKDFDVQPMIKPGRNRKEKRRFEKNAKAARTRNAHQRAFKA